jgi:hypothetical protein
MSQHSKRHPLGAFAALVSAGLWVLTGCPYAKPYVDLGRAVIEAEGKTVSQTPPSQVFPPDNAGKFFALNVASSTGQSIGGKTLRTVELRGWLRAVGTGPNCEDPDWHYDMELDPDWADQKGIDLNQVLKVGNIIEFGMNPTSDSLLQRAVMPLLHIELNGWMNSKHPGQQAPADWGFADMAGNCADTVWPFNPRQPLAWQLELKPGQYVRVVGSIVTDNPHYTTARFPTWMCRNFGTLCNFDEKDTARMNAAKQAWSGGRAEEDENNPARWTEMHPPDIIAVLPDKPQRETLRGVALLSENCAVGTCASASITEDLFPPGPKPTPTSTVHVTELVGPETNFSTIVSGSGNASNNGALVTLLPDRARISISVRGQSLYGAPGKFKALYRVSWKQ